MSVYVSIDVCVCICECKCVFVCECVRVCSIPHFDVDSDPFSLAFHYLSNLF